MGRLVIMSVTVGLLTSSDEDLITELVTKYPEGVKPNNFNEKLDYTLLENYKTMNNEMS